MKRKNNRIRRHIRRNRKEQPWYIETWYQEDLKDALSAAGICVTPENVEKLRNACYGIFDDKSIRNEMLVEMAELIFSE